MFYTENEHFTGPEYATLQRLAKQAGCQLEFVERPWVRALQELHQGKIDMLYSASRSPDREAYAQFSEPYRLEEFVLVTRQGEFNEAEIANLTSWLDGDPRRRFGVIRGYYYGVLNNDVLRDSKRAARSIEVRWDEQLLALLLHRRIDGYLLEAHVADKLSRLAKVQLNHLPDLKAESVRLMFSKSVDQTTVERFNAAILSEQKQPKGQASSPLNVQTVNAQAGN
ncbi:Probably periplasmic transport [gamma proteobacterium HdN1]|nr:Probably periplasmic transport [gamma proteobacterium HdN1]